MFIRSFSVILLYYYKQKQNRHPLDRMPVGILFGFDVCCVGNQCFLIALEHHCLYAYGFAFLGKSTLIWVSCYVEIEIKLTLCCGNDYMD